MKNYQTTYFDITSLRPKSQVKPASVQDRILRRIIEKRLAQVNHRKNRVMVPNELEPINWQNDLDDSQEDSIFVSQFEN